MHWIASAVDHRRFFQSMKSLRILSLLSLVLVLTPAVFAADFGVRAGRYNEGDGEFVGAEMLFDIGAINVNPNIEYVLDEDITQGTANLDITFDVGRFSRVTPYLGAGVGLLYVDDDFGNNNTDLLGNLIGGVGFDLDFIEPYGQVKYFRLLDDENGGDNDNLAFAIGVRF